MASLTINPPALVEYGPMRFVIADAPSDNNLPLYIKEYNKYNVTDVVRVCNPTYNIQTLRDAHFTVHEWPFTDGEPPPQDVIDKWTALCTKVFEDNKQNGSKNAIAVHCVAGLGRAPVLVAVALIEAGMPPLDAVDYVRKRRRGAINNKQIKYVESYRTRASKKNNCIVQ